MFLNPEIQRLLLKIIQFIIERQHSRFNRGLKLAILDHFINTVRTIFNLQLQRHLHIGIKYKFRDFIDGGLKWCVVIERVGVVLVRLRFKYFFGLGQTFFVLSHRDLPYLVLVIPVAVAFLC